MTTEPAADGLPPTGKGAQTRRAILEAAIERFGRDGYRSTSIAEVARGAGVGSTVPFAYFPNKEALFKAALDEDAAAVIAEGVTSIFEDDGDLAWRQTLLLTLADSVERHPLARRVLAGLEPAATGQVLDLPALAELRKALADKLRSDQLAGIVRPDIDPEAIGNGAMAMVISMLMAVLQFGPPTVDEYGPDVIAVFEAAIGRVDPTAARPEQRRP